MLREMSEKDISDACQLIALSMNADEAKWARKTMFYHFKCKENDLDDGRYYFTYLIEQHICALVGLHHYAWGPEENVWLAWFAVHPRFQRQGIGRAMLKAIEKKARSLGYSKLFVETYNQPEFEDALKFYQACGFIKAGAISDYLPSSHAMIVFKKDL